MGAKQDFLAAVKEEQKIIYVIVKKSGLLKSNKKIKFIIKSITSKDIFSKNIREEIMKERSSGQSVGDACRVVVEQFKKDLDAMNEDSTCKFLFDKGIVYPKVVDKIENLKEDELPYQMLKSYHEIKLQLIKEIIKISPIFQG